MECTVNEGLQVSDHNMDQRQPVACLFRWCHLLFMGMFLSNRIQGRKCIGTHLLTCLQMTTAKLAYTVFTNRINSFRRHETGMIPAVFNRYENRLLTRSSPTTLSRLLATHIRIVTFYQTFKPIDAVPVRHNRTDLMQNTVSSTPSCSYMLAQTQSGNAPFVRGAKVYSPEPLDQGQIGRMKDGSRCHTCLVLAMTTLVTLARSYVAVSFSRTDWTYESIWPSHSGQSLGTSFLGTKSTLPFYKKRIIPIFNLCRTQSPYPVIIVHPVITDFKLIPFLAMSGERLPARLRDVHDSLS